MRGCLIVSLTHLMVYTLCFFKYFKILGVKLKLSRVACLCCVLEQENNSTDSHELQKQDRSHQNHLDSWGTGPNINGRDFPKNIHHKKCALFSVVLTQEVNSFSCTAERKQAVLIENGKVLMYSSISFLWNQSQ